MRNVNFTIKMSNIRIENDNTDKILSELEQVTKKGLFDVGMEASGDVAEFIRDEGIVDTGLLKNSITFALDGESANIGTYRADEGDGKGSYSGSTPKANHPTVYIGTNVEYAKYVQYGTSRMPVGRDFMFAPLRANLGRYKQILENYIKGL